MTKRLKPTLNVLNRTATPHSSVEKKSKLLAHHRDDSGNRPCITMHNLHNENPSEIAATTSQRCTCTVQIRVGKNSEGVCITGGDPMSEPEITASQNSDSGVSAAAAAS